MTTTTYIGARASARTLCTMKRIPTCGACVNHPGIGVAWCPVAHAEKSEHSSVCFERGARMRKVTT